MNAGGDIAQCQMSLGMRSGSPHALSNSTINTVKDSVETLVVSACKTTPPERRVCKPAHHLDVPAWTQARARTDSHAHMPTCTSSSSVCMYTLAVRATLSTWELLSAKEQTPEWSLVVPWKRTLSECSSARTHTHTHTCKHTHAHTCTPQPQHIHK